MNTVFVYNFGDIIGFVVILLILIILFVSWVSTTYEKLKDKFIKWRNKNE